LFEIVIPLRNPTEVLLKTVQSLLAQTERCFSVLLSDNGSGAENAFVAEAMRLLDEANIPVRRIRPPEELGRVEHWNWSHRQAGAEWIKPLFVGDWLEPGYAAAIRAAIEARSGAEIINCSFRRHLTGGGIDDAIYPGGFRSPAEVMEQACRVGNDFGGPINICFRKLAFELVGGYPPALPVSADFWLIIMLALRGGLYTCPDVLGNFNYHPHRFTTNFPMERIHGDRELFIILLAATSQANFNQVPVNVRLRNRFFARLLKRTVKERLQRSLKQDPPA
jgi:glycosyltransferase involved in cell wall biosynthesis